MAHNKTELAVLRTLGLTPGQIQALVLLQSGLLGSLAGLLALPLGALQAAEPQDLEAVLDIDRRARADAGTKNGLSFDVAARW